MTGKQLREYRIKRGLTQKQLAEIIGTQRCCVCNWENGKHRISRLAQFRIKSKIGSLEVW